MFDIAKLETPKTSAQVAAKKRAIMVEKLLAFYEKESLLIKVPETYVAKLNLLSKGANRDIQTVANELQDLIVRIRLVMELLLLGVYYEEWIEFTAHTLRTKLYEEIMGL